MERVCLDRVEIDRIAFDEAVDYILSMTCMPFTRSRQVTTVNAQFIRDAHTDPRLADLIRNADLSVADGVPLVWASRLLSTPLPGRINGTDLMVRLCEEAAILGKTVYFLGGHPGSANIAAENILKFCPELKIAGIDCPPVGFTVNLEQDLAVSQKIQAAEPDIVFVALGAPKAEYWIQEHSHLSAKVMIGVGGSFELVGGVIKRAPKLLQRLGCEWAWRLLMEPRRLWRRYFFGNSLFVYLILRQWWRGHPVAEPKVGVSPRPSSIPR